MSLRAFRNTIYAPPGGIWFYTIPELGLYVDSRESFAKLLYRVKDAYRANGREIPGDLPALIQDHMCARLPEGFCTGKQVPGAPRLYLSFFEVLKDTETILRGAVRTDASTALQRAAICRACEFNSMALCTSCTDLRKIAQGLVGGRTSDLKGLEKFIGVCRKTGCVASGLVFAAPATLLERVVGPAKAAGEEFPGPCWMNKIS